MIELFILYKGVSNLDCRVMSIREKQWMDIITACNASDMNKKEWMRIHNVSPKNFYRWQKVLRERALTEMEEYRYPVLPPYCEEPSEQDSSKETSAFVDMTAMISREAEAASKPQMDAVGQKQLEPELMIQAGPYHLYIGSGITESTLAMVLKVIGNA